MQEIFSNVYIESSYAGVTLGAITCSHGLILVDSPFRPEDARSWRSVLLNLGGGVDRLLVNLDPHLDRTLGVRAMECTVVGHEKMAEVFRNRPVTFKAQPAETGAEWELHNNLGSVRWLPPEITFTDQFFIHWDGSPVVLEHKPGPNIGSIWLRMPEEKIAFIGDTVVVNQPPFLGSANLPVWIQRLKELLSPEFQDYILISGRGGILRSEDVHHQLHLIEGLHAQLENLAHRSALPSEVERLAPEIMRQYSVSLEFRILYENRLRYGLQHYYLRHYRPADLVEAEE
jgi:glyoxylase-like metal-dependent hydrolase (beta-lactamase superfamily II)